MEPRHYHIGIDDTDAGASIGTGALARELQVHLLQRFGGRAAGITRHQLLLHPDIPYTSHNSSACLSLWLAANRAAVVAAGEAFVRFLFHEGADPGLCVADHEAPSPAFVALGRRAQTEVVAKEAAVECGRSEGVHLAELGGTGLGVIGALAACALRMGGDDGRFIQLDRIRELRGDLTVRDILARAPVDRVEDEGGAVLGPDCLVHTNGWVRPALAGGRVVLRVARAGDEFVIVNRKREEE